MDFDVTRKVGPLPAWAWGVILAGGVYLYSRRRGGSGGGLLSGWFGGESGTGAADSTDAATGWSGVTPTAAPVTMTAGATLPAAPATAKKATAKKVPAKKATAKKATAKKPKPTRPTPPRVQSKPPAHTGGSRGDGKTRRARPHKPVVKSAKPNRAGGVSGADATAARIMGTDLDQQLAALQGQISGATRQTDQTIATGVIAGLGGPNYG